MKARSSQSIAQPPVRIPNPCRRPRTAYSSFVRVPFTSGGCLVHPRPEDATCLEDTDYVQNSRNVFVSAYHLDIRVNGLAILLTLTQKLYLSLSRNQTRKTSTAHRNTVVYFCTEPFMLAVRKRVIAVNKLKDPSQAMKPIQTRSSVFQKLFISINRTVGLLKGYVISSISLASSAFV